MSFGDTIRNIGFVWLVFPQQSLVVFQLFSYVVPRLSRRQAIATSSTNAEPTTKRRKTGGTAAGNATREAPDTIHMENLKLD